MLAIRRQAKRAPALRDAYNRQAQADAEPGDNDAKKTKNNISGAAAEEKSYSSIEGKVWKTRPRSNLLGAGAIIYQHGCLVKNGPPQPAGGARGACTALYCTAL